MSVTIKSEPIVGVVELSSDDEETVSTLSTINNGIPNNEIPNNEMPNNEIPNNGIPNIGPTGRSSTPVTQCSICLDNLTNECHTNSCSHLFCFKCLQRWSYVSLTDP